MVKVRHHAKELKVCMRKSGVDITILINVFIFSFLVERRRRFNINDRIKELGTMIPKTNDL